MRKWFSRFVVFFLNCSFFCTTLSAHITFDPYEALGNLAFKGLAPTKPTSLDPDEQKAYSDAIDRTAIAAKLLAPIDLDPLENQVEN